jgi:hypothetical protein
MRFSRLYLFDVKQPPRLVRMEACRRTLGQKSSRLDPPPEGEPGRD